MRHSRENKMLPPQHKHLTNFIIRLPALEFLCFDKWLPLSELHILTLFTTMKLTSISWKILTYAIFFGLYHWGFCFFPSEKNSCKTMDSGSLLSSESN